MKIKVLGTRGDIVPSLPYHSKHTGILIDKSLLLDFGEKEFLKYKPNWILLSHLHHDHAVFVKDHVCANIPIYAPEKEFSSPKGHQECLPVKIIDKKAKIGPYTITPIPTLHSKRVKSQGYLIKRGKFKLFYTGDVIGIEKKHHHLFRDLDLVICEASFLRRGGLVRKDKKTGKRYGHTGVPNSISLFKKFTKNILFVHFGSWFFADTKKARKKFRELGKEHGVEIYVAYDGMELNLPG